MENKQDHQDLAPAVVFSSILIICLAIISVALRMWSRSIAKAGYWYDDFAILVALPIAIVLPLLLLIAVRFDFGKHVAAARPGAETEWFKILYTFEIFYIPSIAITKFSILLFYARIFPARNFNRVLYAVGFVTLVWWISTQMMAVFQCHPIHSFWTQFHDGSKCIDLKAYFIGQAVPNITTDLVLLVLPLPCIWRLQLPVSQRLMLTWCFTFGGFVAFTSIYRLYLFTGLRPGDDTYNDAKAANWSSLEANVGITSACLPMCRPLLKLLIAKSRGLRGFKSSMRELMIFERNASHRPEERLEHYHLDGFPEVHTETLAFKAVKKAEISLQRTELCNQTSSKEQLEASPQVARSENGGADQVSSRSMV